jgi:hypothetical protein
LLQSGGLAPFSDDAEDSSSDDEAAGRVHGSSFNRNASLTDSSSSITASTTASATATDAVAADSDDDVTAAVSSTATTAATSSSFAKNLACQLRHRTEVGSFRLSECADVGAHFVPNALHTTIARYGERVSSLDRDHTLHIRNIISYVLADAAMLTYAQLWMLVDVRIAVLLQSLVVLQDIMWKAAVLTCVLYCNAMSHTHTQNRPTAASSALMALCTTVHVRMRTYVYMTVALCSLSSRRQYTLVTCGRGPSCCL